MTSTRNHINYLFDRAQKVWDSHYSKNAAVIALLAVYILSLVLIEMGRRHLLPAHLAGVVPHSHYAAISIAFTLLLYLEVIELVFSLATSVSSSVGKQFEIFSLILLRQSFKDFSELPEPLQWPVSVDTVLHILSSAGGALFIFAVLAFFYRMLRRTPLPSDESETTNFITAKKALALLILLLFVGFGTYNLLSFIFYGTTQKFFAIFYTILVFCDILIVLISMRYSHYYPIVFRNSGFALATVVLRLGLAAPAYYNAALGAGAALYVLGIIAVYNFFSIAPKKPSGI